MFWLIRRGQHGLRACRCLPSILQALPIPNPGEGLPSPYPSRGSGPAVPTAGIKNPSLQFLSHVLANIQYFAFWPLLEKHENLHFCSTYKLKRLFSFCDNSYISKTISKTCPNPKIKIIKKRQGFSSKLMVQSLKIHLPKSHFRHFFITRVRTLSFQNC